MHANSHRNRSASPLIGALLPALAAALALAPAAAHANDRDLRGRSVPAAACVEHFRTVSFVGSSWIPDGYFTVGGTNQGLLLQCPLPVNSVSRPVGYDQ